MRVNLIKQEKVIFVIKTFEDVIAFLEAHPSNEYSRVQLDAYLAVHPLQFSRPAIHLTGSNGKGSTATFIASMYEASGRQVGVFTSPSLEHYTDMIRINQHPIDELFITQYFQQHAVEFDHFRLTSFEMTTLCAYAYFEYQRVDVAVIEVGMGGTIDATNMMTPVLSIMTNVSLEHVDVLGPTITHITEHKAGIIKPNIPVLIGPLVEEARVVVNKKIHQTKSRLYETLPYTWDKKDGLCVGSYRNLQLRLQGSYQHANVALAIQAITVLQSEFHVEENAIRQGVASAFIPGRLETIHTSPTILLDGGHNPDGVRVLVEAMQAYRDQPIDVLFAAFKDKDIDPMLHALKTIASSIMLTTFHHPRARQRHDYDASFSFTDDYESFINHFAQTKTTNRVLLITGSLAFIGIVRQWFFKKRT